MLRNRIFRDICLGHQRPCGKAITLPPVNIVHHRLANELVAANPGHNLGPDEPEHATCAEDTEADNAVDVVRQGLVDALAVGGWHKGREDEVDVAEAEEGGDGEGGLDGRVPVVGFAVAVEVDEAACDKNVDDGERVRDEATGG